jgi:peptide/nickel transport system substrate-binding protein
LAQQGLSVQVEYLLGPSLREYLSKGQIHLWKASWLADFPDGENFLVLFESSQCMPAGPNTTRFRHVQMDSLIRAARATPDEEKRRSLYTLAEALLQEEVPVIPLYHAHGIWVVRQGIQRFPRSPLPVWLPLEGVVLPCEATSPNSPLLN